MTEPKDSHWSEREKTLIRQLEDAQREARDNQWAIEEITHRLQDSLKRGGQREKRLAETLLHIKNNALRDCDDDGVIDMWTINADDINLIESALTELGYHEQEATDD